MSRSTDILLCASNFLWFHEQSDRKLLRASVRKMSTFFPDFWLLNLKSLVSEALKLGEPMLSLYWQWQQWLQVSTKTLDMIFLIARMRALLHQTLPNIPLQGASEKATDSSINGNFSNKGISDVPAEIPRFTTELYLNRNKISVISETSGLSKLPNLVKL